MMMKPTDGGSTAVWLGGHLSCDRNAFHFVCDGQTMQDALLFCCDGHLPNVWLRGARGPLRKWQSRDTVIPEAPRLFAFCIQPRTGGDCYG